MNIADELRKLHDLHQRGALTDEEFATAKEAVLSGRAAPTERGADRASDQVMQEHLEEIKLQNELARLDREWGLERERYMIAGGRYGQRYIPNRGMSIFGGVFIVGFGIFWTVMAASMSGGFDGGFAVFPCFGVLFILAGIAMSIYSYSKATQYEQAHQAYRNRRSRLLSSPTPEPPIVQQTPERFDTAVRAEVPSEPIQCLECGKVIPADTSKCPHCGWSYSKS